MFSDPICAGKKNIRDWMNISALDKLIGIFIDSAPRNETTHSIRSHIPFKPLLARATLRCLCAAVILYTIEMDKTPTFYARRLAAARWMAAIYRELGTYGPHPYRDICHAVCGIGRIILCLT